MINSTNRRNKQYEYFGYMNRSIEEALCSTNGLHRDLYGRGVNDGYLLTFAGKPSDTYRAVEVSEIITENGVLAEEIAYWNAAELRQYVIPLPLDFEQYYSKALLTSYILNSTLCYVEVTKKTGKEGFYATKNLEVLKAISNNFKLGEKKKLNNFQTQLTTSYPELTNNNFDVVSLVKDVDGLKLSKRKLNANVESTTIVPLYSIANYLDKVIGFIGNHKVKLTYEENGEEKEFLTSLHTHVLTNWLRTKDKNYIQKIQQSWSNPFVFSEIILPNLSEYNHFMKLSVLDIRNIQKVN